MVNKYGPWIGWNGGTPPVDKNITVQVVGTYGGRVKHRAHFIDWNRSHNPIVAYRVKLEPEVKQWETNIVVMLEENGGKIMVNYKELKSWEPHVPISHRDDFQRLKITATQTGDDPVFEIERIE